MLRLLGVCSGPSRGRLSHSQLKNGGTMILDGTWGADGLPFLELTIDGRQRVSGSAHWRAPGRNHVVPIETGFFDSDTGSFRLEGDAPSLDGDGASRYVILGTLDRDMVSGTYDCGGLKGN